MADSAGQAKAKTDEAVPVATTADERRRQVEDEYGKYVATEQIIAPSGGLAFNVGDPIPTSTVERKDNRQQTGVEGEWLHKGHAAVALRDSDEGRAAIRRAAGLEE